MNECGASTVFYDWSMFLTNGSRVDILSQLNIERSNDYVIVKSYIFQEILRPGGEGVVQLEVWRESGESGYINETIRVNEPPVAGNCSCHPKTGEGYRTDFQVTCIGWVDPDTPLRFLFSYSYDGDVTPIPKSSKNPNSSSEFKILKEPDEGMSATQIPITISIEDSLGWKTEMVIYAEVSCKLQCYYFINYNIYCLPKTISNHNRCS